MTLPTSLCVFELGNRAKAFSHWGLAGAGLESPQNLLEKHTRPAAAPGKTWGLSWSDPPGSAGMEAPCRTSWSWEVSWAIPGSQLSPSLDPSSAHPEIPTQPIPGSQLSPSQDSSSAGLSPSQDPSPDSTPRAARVGVSWAHPQHSSH